MKFIRLPGILLILLCLGFALSQFSGSDKPKGPKKPEVSEETPLQIVLRDGEKASSPGESREFVEGTPLPDERVKELKKLFGESLPAPRDRPEFLKRASSKPAPRATQRRELSFPASAVVQPDEVAQKALEVTSISPEGEVNRAPRLSISFNSPMVDVSDAAGVESGDPMGITLQPRPSGKWRWLGTQTLIFEPTAGEFPRATDYEVTVPAGVVDIRGTKLSEAVRQKFTTARPGVVSFSPARSGVGLRPLITVVFNQPVVPAATAPLVRLKQARRNVPLTSISVQEAESMEEGVRERYKDELNGRVLFFVAKEELQPGSRYTLSVAKGVKGVEGPLLSSKTQSADFFTFDKLYLSDREPQKGEEVSPFESFSLEFNNRVDHQGFDPTWISVSPKPENLAIYAIGNNVHLRGEKKGNTTYEVTVSPDLTDEFGQKLGKVLRLEMKTGRAPKKLDHGFEAFTLMQAGEPAVLPVFTTNVKRLKLRVNRVEAKDWAAYLKLTGARSYRSERSKTVEIPGTPVAELEIPVEQKPDELVSTPIDLFEYLKEGEGNLVVWVGDPDETDKDYQVRELLTWVQSTNLGIDMTTGAQKAAVLVTNLSDGKPVPGAELELGLVKGKTDSDGLCAFELPQTETPILKVRNKETAAFLPFGVYPWSYKDGWQLETFPADAEWILFDDRGLYKPGEKANIKGYVRSWQRGPSGQLVSPEAGTEVDWVLQDPRRNKLKEGKIALDASGGVDLEVEIPSDIDLGYLVLVIKGASLPPGYHELEVQEFRRPEFEVDAQVVSDGPHLLHGSTTVEATAKYLAGGVLGSTEVDWVVNTRPSSYSPPGRSDYTFGKWRPWWDLGFWDERPTYKDASRFEHTGRTDAEGSHQLAMDFVEMWPPRPTVVEVTATVADVNRQEQASSSNLLVHPSERYVGLKTEKSFVDEEDFELSLVVTDIDGRILPGVPVELELLKLDYEQGLGRGFQQKEVGVEKKSLTTSETPSTVILSPQDGGTYHVRASVRDKKGRLNQTEYTLWKAGGKLPSRDKVEEEELVLVPDKKEYQPGETARILVMAPFSEGEGLVVWNRDGILREDRFSLKNGTAVLKQPMTEELIPRIGASITVVGKAAWGNGERPALATADLDLAVSTRSRSLTVEIEATDERLDPGSEVDVPVVVKDSAGRPVSGAEVTLWMVDEAILGLAGYVTPDPLSRFYAYRSNSVEKRHNRVHVALGDPETPEEPEPMASATPSDSAVGQRISRTPLLGDLPILGTMFRGQGRRDNDGLRNGGSPYLNYDNLVGSAAGSSYDRSRGLDPVAALAAPKFSPAMGWDINDDIDAGAEFSAYASDTNSELASYWANQPPDKKKKFAIRKNFSPQVVYKSDLKTDPSGRTTVHTKLPDSLTRYRIMAVAVKDSDKFGHGEQALTAALPLMVRPSLPRFLNFGDKAKLPVVLQNQTGEDMTVDVIGEATGVTLTGSTGQRVKVPANERVEVLFEAETDGVGLAQFRFGAVSGSYSDAATVSLPVYTPASTEDFATYGQVAGSEAIKQMVKRPKDVWPQFGGLEVSLSSTALSELTDTFLYLYQYPYECSEQKSSRILAMVAMQDVLSAFNPDAMPSKAAIRQRMTADIKHLERLQGPDGGWDYWKLKAESKPFVTVHVMHALARAKMAGYEVDPLVLTSGLDYLKSIEGKCRVRGYALHSTQSCTAYALFVQNLLKEPDVASAKALFKKLKDDKHLELESLGWLWPTFAEHAKGSSERKELKRLVMNKATETADKAHFTTEIGETDGTYLTLHSARRTDAILLGALLQDDPTNQLNTKLVRGLLAHRTKGRWNNTQENIWVLLALQSYFRAYEKQTPNFLAGVWLDETYLGEEQFVGRSAKEAQLKIPMNELPQEEQGLILSKKGQSRLYYRVGMKYAPKSLRLPAESRGFMVERTFKGADAPTDVKQLENGDWQIKAGAKVEVTLTLVCPETRYHVALVDSLAAGLEPLNPALEGTPSTDSESSWWNWYDHENLRDERVEVFSQRLSAGVRTYTYTALATTPGEYVLPPLKAEEMYSPEVFGRTASGKLIVD